MSVWKDIAPPLPVSLVTTVDGQGRPNASPKTWWTPTSYDPPLMMLFLKPESDTAQNIEQTGNWVLHLPRQGFAEKVLHTAKAHPPGVNELDEVGLEWEWYEHPKLPLALPLIRLFPWLICWAVTKWQSGDHVMFEGQVGVAGGFDDTEGVSNVILHRSRNVFVWTGEEYEVPPYKEVK